MPPVRRSGAEMGEGEGEEGVVLDAEGLPLRHEHLRSIALRERPHRQDCLRRCRGVHQRVEVQRLADQQHPGAHAGVDEVRVQRRADRKEPHGVGGESEDHSAIHQPALNG